MPLDPRTTPARPDLAARHLEGQVSAERFVTGTTLQVTAPVLDLIRTTDRDAGLDSQLLMGETFLVLESDPDTALAWGQSERDGYVGYVSLSGLEEAAAPDHIVTAVMTHVYPEPNIKTRPLEALSFLSTVHVMGDAGDFCAIGAGGYVPRQHLAPLAHRFDDPAMVAESFLGLPYLWGGRSSFGMDCSGLTQLSCQACGIALPRDSDMQLEIGQQVENRADLARGDLVLWKGHVGTMLDGHRLLHANATHMKVVIEDLDSAVRRIEAAEYGPVIGMRRL